MLFRALFKKQRYAQHFNTIIRSWRISGQRQRSLKINKWFVISKRSPNKKIIITSSLIKISIWASPGIGPRGRSRKGWGWLDSSWARVAAVAHRGQAQPGRGRGRGQGSAPGHRIARLASSKVTGTPWSTAQGKAKTKKANEKKRKPQNWTKATKNWAENNK